MKRTKQILSLLLAALLGLTACGSGGKREIHKIDWVMSPAYAAEDIALPVPTGDLIGCCTDGETMYILADEKTEDDAVHTTFCRVNLADGAVTEMEDYLSTEPPEDAIINRLGPVLSPDGSLWLYETWSLTYYDLPEDFDPEKESKAKYLTGQDDFHHLRQLDSVTGREKKLTDLSEAVRTLDVADILDVAGFTVDGKGNVYFAGTGGVAVLDNKGNYLFTLEAAIPRTSFAGTSGGTLALLPDGTVAALTTQPGGGREVRAIDVSAKNWKSARYELSNPTDLIYSGTGGFLFYYMINGELYAWEPEAEAERKLLNWSSARLDGSLMCFAPLDGGNLAALSRVYSSGADADWYSDGIRLTMLSPTTEQAAAEDGRITLVYGSMSAPSDLLAEINRFNRTNEDYFIEIRTYGDNGYEAGLTRLNAEVASGRAPDLWGSSLPISAYARKGYLEDLWPWIESDPELGRDAVMSHVLDCASMDGKLYFVSNSFQIYTLVGCSAIVGDRVSWTMDEMLEIYNALPEGTPLLNAYYNDAGLSLLLFLQMNLGRWVDWSTGECHFDAEDFKSVLELCGRLGEGSGLDDTYYYVRDMDGGEALRTGRQLLVEAQLVYPKDILFYEALCGGQEVMEDYKTRLNEAGIYAHRVDEEGNRRPEDTVLCSMLNQEEDARESGSLWGSYPLADDVRFGALEGSGYASFIGYPAEEGAGSYFHMWNEVAVSASCAHKEGAWAFVRQQLLPEGLEPIKAGDTLYSSRTGFPINRAAFESAMRPEDPWFRTTDGEYILDSDGERIEMPTDDTMVRVGIPVKMAVYPTPLSEEQIDRFMELYNAIDRFDGSDGSLMSIVTEQAEPYFAGDKSLDETVDLIQRRAPLYVNENR